MSEKSKIKKQLFQFNEKYEKQVRNIKNKMWEYERLLQPKRIETKQPSPGITFSFDFSKMYFDELSGYYVVKADFP